MLEGVAAETEREGEPPGSAGTFDLDISIRTMFSMLTVEAKAGEIERGLYADVEAMSDLGAERLAEPNRVAGA